MFYEAGKRALKGTLYTSEGLYRMANQFVRGPYFQNLVAAEEDTQKEREAISDFAANQPGVEKARRGFSGFPERSPELAREDDSAARRDVREEQLSGLSPGSDLGFRENGFYQARDAQTRQRAAHENSTADRFKRRAFPWKCDPDSSG